LSQNAHTSDRRLPHAAHTAHVENLNRLRRLIDPRLIGFYTILLRALQEKTPDKTVPMLLVGIMQDKLIAAPAAAYVSATANRTELGRATQFLHFCGGCRKTAGFPHNDHVNRFFGFWYCSQSRFEVY
jgi:hypothetical protein